MSRRAYPSFPELETTSLPELFEQIIPKVVGPRILAALRAIASRWHDPNCECKFKVTEGGQLVEKEACLRCSNVRRSILERL